MILFYILLLPFWPLYFPLWLLVKWDENNKEKTKQAKKTKNKR